MQQTKLIIGESAEMISRNTRQWLTLSSLTGTSSTSRSAQGGTPRGINNPVDFRDASGNGTYFDGVQLRTDGQFRLYVDGLAAAPSAISSELVTVSVSKGPTSTPANFVRANFGTVQGGGTHYRATTQATEIINLNREALELVQVTDNGGNLRFQVRDLTAAYSALTGTAGDGIAAGKWVAGDYFQVDQYALNLFGGYISDRLCVGAITNDGGGLYSFDVLDNDNATNIAYSIDSFIGAESAKRFFRVADTTNISVSGATGATAVQPATEVNNTPAIGELQIECYTDVVTLYTAVNAGSWVGATFDREPLSTFINDKIFLNPAVAVDYELLISQQTTAITSATFTAATNFIDHAGSTSANRSGAETWSIFRFEIDNENYLEGSITLTHGGANVATIGTGATEHGVVNNGQSGTLFLYDPTGPTINAVVEPRFSIVENVVISAKV